MAKELPYFKFEPGAWDNGNIQMCSREAKGLFIDLCSIYWSRLGELPYALALQKHCMGNAQVLQELQDADIFGVVDGQIIIEFLDEQLNEFQETSEKRRKAAQKRWSDASALQKQSKSNAIREEKKRGKKKIEEEKAPEALVYPWEDLEFTQQWETWKAYKKTEHKFSFKSPTSEQASLMDLQKKSSGDMKTAIAIIHQSIAQGWKGFFELQKQNQNGKFTQSTHSRLTDEQLEALARNRNI